MPKEEEDDAEEDEEDEEEEAELELEVVLDDEGRITGTSDIGLNFDFYSSENSHLTSSIPLEKDIVSTLKSDVDAIFDGCTTFWLPAINFEPRTTFERLAKQIFDFHTKHLKSNVEIDWEQSGAEYWTQKRDLSGGKRKDKDEHEDEIEKEDNISTSSHVVLENDDTMIRFHFDKDEELVDQTEGGITVHPQLSTITYLTDGGNPTLIFPYRQPPLTTANISVGVNDDENNDIVEEGEDKDNNNDNDREKESNHQINEIFASYPKLGKHVSFDGRYLHGCPSALSLEAPPHGIRMTFLVNIWLNWKPLGPEVYADEDLALLSNVPVELADLTEKPQKITSLDDASVEDECVDQADANANTVDDAVKKEAFYIILPLGHQDTIITAAAPAAAAAAESKCDGDGDVDDDDEANQCFTAYFGPRGWDQTLHFPWPSKTSVHTALVKTQCSSVCVQCPPDPELSCHVRTTIRPSLTVVPSIEYNENTINHQVLFDLFKQSKVLLIKNFYSSTNVTCNTMESCLKSVGNIYNQFPQEVSACWEFSNGNQANEDTHTQYHTPKLLFGKKKKTSSEKMCLSSPSRKKQKITDDVLENNQWVSHVDKSNNSSIDQDTTQPWQVHVRVIEAVNPEVFQQTVTAFHEQTECPSLFNIISNSNNDSNSSSNSSITTHTIIPTDCISLMFGRHSNSCTVTATPEDNDQDDDSGEEEEGEEEEDVEDSDQQAECDSHPHTLTGTYFLSLCGSAPPWFIQPDETQDWRTGPPPETLHRRPLRVDVSVGDILLINRKFWGMHCHDPEADEHDCDMDDDDSGGDDAAGMLTTYDPQAQEMQQVDGGEELYFTVTCDFTASE